LELVQSASSTGIRLIYVISSTKLLYVLLWISDFLFLSFDIRIFIAYL